MEMSIQEALELLGLGPEATMSDIRSAYRRSARKWHPDMHRVIGGDPSRYREYGTDHGTIEGNLVRRGKQGLLGEVCEGLRRIQQ